MIDDRAATAAFAALAHGDRIAAFRMLVRAGPSGLPSGAIAEGLAIPATRMSFHLAGLERAGLIHSWRDGRNVRYAPQFETMRQLLAFLTEDCCDGRPEICGELASFTDTCGTAG